MRALTAVASSTTEVVVSWEPPDGSYQDAYQVAYAISESSWKKTLNKLTGLKQTVDELKPGHTYTFEVKAISSYQFSSAETATATVCKCDFTLIFVLFVVILLVLL